MNAEIITIGDEILIGQIVDSNSAYIGKELTKIGIEVNQITTVKDDREKIINALKTASKRSEIIIITGGLGPTKDDITKKTLAEYFEDHFVVNQEALKNIMELFKRIDEPILQTNIDQAQLPSKASALPNKYGTAPGMWFEEDQVVYVSLPGVPYEMKALMKEVIIPKLKHKFKRPYILYKTVLTYGVGESRIAERIKDWEEALPSFMKLAYLPSPGRVRLRLTARGEKKQALKQALDKYLESLNMIIGDIIGGYEGDFSIGEEIAHKLTTINKTLATAESCTGGKIASIFTDIPGASTYFKGGIVPYFTSTKVDFLGVSKEIMEQYSVVSAEIAKEMARQTQKKFNSYFVLATTGNAGPTKGNSDAELGTVFIALAYGDNIEVKEFHLGDSREKVVKKAVYKALVMLKDNLLDY